MVDSRNSRIDELSASGTFMRAFGRGIADEIARPEVCIGACRAGIAGSGIGQLNEPTGIAIDSKGELWVVDGANQRADEFSPAGEYITQFGPGGSSSGQFAGPWGIALAGGSADVADGANNRIEKWAESE